MDYEEQARASHMTRVQDEAQHGIRPYMDLAERSVTMLRQQTEPTWRPSQAPVASITIGIDFGNSNTAVSFSRDGEGSRPIITDIKNFPNDPLISKGVPSSQVPTETWYSKSTIYEDDQETEFDSNQFMIEEDDMELIDPEESDICWGYGVRSELRPDKPRSKYNHVTQSKLLLDNIEDITTINPRRHARRETKANTTFRTQETRRPRSDLFQSNMETRSGLLIPRAKIRHNSPPTPIRGRDEVTENDHDELRKTLRRLKRSGLIKSETDVITHFMTSVMRHVKRQLIEVHKIPPSTLIRYVASVPVTWKPIASFVVEDSLRVAVETAGLGTMTDLFLVSEPEAAANYLMQKTREIKPGDKFLILDCGGGTIDATAYQAEKEYPLRLSKELVDPGGCTHGSGLLNRDFRKHVKRRIEGQRENIERDGYTLDGILDEGVLRFEDVLKRHANIYILNAKPESLPIQGLREDREKRIVKNNVQMYPNHFREIFMPHLQGIGRLLRAQLTSAREKGHEITKVPITGGFSASLSLVKYLEKELEKLSTEFGYKIQLIHGLLDMEPEIAVVHGALIRASDKSGGPRRISQLSYGFEVMEEYDPEIFSAHKETKPTVDKTDGRYYVHLDRSM